MEIIDCRAVKDKNDWEFIRSMDQLKLFVGPQTRLQREGRCVELYIKIIIIGLIVQSTITMQFRD